MNQKTKDKKVGLLLKQKIIVSVVIIVLLLLVILLFNKTEINLLNKKQIIINNNKFNATVVDDNQEREKGLSGWQSLEKNQVMLFVYSGEGQYCIWMKDMNFAIDIIWLDNNKKVVDKKENATPESYPKEVFCSNKDSKYTIETPAGIIQNLGLKIGDQVKF